MLEESTQVRCTPKCCLASSDFCSWESAAHCVDGVVVEGEELCLAASPVADVGLVPGLPVPRLHFGPAVYLDAVLGPLIDRLGPFGTVLGRVCPACINLIVVRSGRQMMLVGLWMG